MGADPEAEVLLGVWLQIWALASLLSRLRTVVVVIVIDQRGCALGESEVGEVVYVAVSGLLSEFFGGLEMLPSEGDDFEISLASLG